MNYQREVEAESVAYVVCSHFGLDTSEKSFGYIAGWSGESDLTVFKNSLDRIQKAASELISDISKNLEPFQHIIQPEQKNEESLKSPASVFSFSKTYKMLSPLIEQAAKMDPSKAAGQATYKILMKKFEGLYPELPEGAFKKLVGEAKNSLNLETMKPILSSIKSIAAKKEQDFER